MNTGKTLFAQLMDFLPWTTFTRIVDRYGGDHRVRTLSCAEQYRSMAFAQLTYRESLRDIETCLSVHASKLYHMGFRQPVRRSTLADANERRDWRIHAALAQRLITQARTLYVDKELGLDLTNTVYALDSTTIALCLSVFPWAHFRTTKAAVKMHTLLDLRGNIPSFIHISDGKLHDVHALDMLLPEAGAIYVVDRGYVDFARLYVLHQAGAFFVTRAKSNIDAHRVYSAPTDRSTGIICDQTISLDGFYTRQDYPELLRRIRFKDPESGKTLVFITNNLSLPAATICALYKSRWQVELFFKWIKQHLRIKQFYGTSENAVKTQIWIAVSVYVLVAIVKKRLDLDASLYTLLQILSVTLFEKMPIHQALAGDENRCNASQITNQLNLFDFNRTLERVRHRQNQKGDSQGSQKVIQAMSWVKGGQPWMTRPYSEDLRERVVRVVESGTSRNAAAKQFDVSISFVVKLMQRWKQRGTIKADKYGGWKKSNLAPHGDRIRALVMENCDITIDELCVLLAAEGIEAKRSTLGDFLLAQGLSRKKRQPTPPSRSALTSRRREPLGATSNLG